MAVRQLRSWQRQRAAQPAPAGPGRASDARHRSPSARQRHSRGCDGHAGARVRPPGVPNAARCARCALDSGQSPSRTPASQQQGSCGCRCQRDACAEGGHRRPFAATGGPRHTPTRAQVRLRRLFCRQVPRRLRPRRKLNMSGSSAFRVACTAAVVCALCLAIVHPRALAVGPPQRTSTSPGTAWTAWTVRSCTQNRKPRPV